MSAVKIRQIRSANGTNPNQKATLKALGLGRIGKSVERKDSAAAAGSAAGRLAPGGGELPDGRQTPRSEEIGLHNLKPKPGSKRPRKRIGRGEGSGLGKTSGRGHKGAGSRSGAQAARPATRAARTRSTCGCESCAARTKSSRCRSRTSAPRRSRSTSPTSRSASTRRRGDAGERSRRRAWPSARTRSRSSPAARSRRSSRSTRTRSARPPRRRSRRPAVPVTLWSRNAQNYSQRVQRCRHSQEARLHGGDAGAVPARRLHPGAGRRRRRRQGNLRTTSAAPASSASSTSSPAAASRASASSRWGSCPTSPPRSSCSC